MSDERTSKEWVSLTRDQKLQAFAARFYQGVKWMLTDGDYYTSTRADLELYRVVKIDGEKVFTEYCTQPGRLSEWSIWTFTTEGFGPNRMWVPPWVLNAGLRDYISSAQPPDPALAAADALRAAAVSYAGDTGLHSEAWLWDKIREFDAARSASTKPPLQVPNGVCTCYLDPDMCLFADHGWLPPQDFSWYEGEPDKKVIADIVRLKRDGKLGGSSLTKGDSHGER